MADDTGRLAARILGTPNAFAIARPSSLPFVDLGSPDPLGRFIAVSFADPSAGDPQLYDLWLLDPIRRKFNHVPGMPIGVELKFTSLTWALNGELVLLTRMGGRDTLLTWHPGEARMRKRTYHMPSRVVGREAIAAWQS